MSAGCGAAWDWHGAGPVQCEGLDYGASKARSGPRAVFDTPWLKGQALPADLAFRSPTY